MSPPAKRDAGASSLPRLALALASLWILVGACFKLFAGTPADLPPIVREAPAAIGIGVGLTYRLAIAIELCVAFLALLRPRLGWLPIALVYVVFELVLTTLLGQESCGCFGSKVSLAPEAMVAIDGALLAFVLLTRPWKKLRPGGANVVVLAGAFAVAIALPWLLDREVPKTTLVVDGEEQDTDGAAWLALDVERWVGKDVWDTPIADSIDMSQVQLDGLWIFYRSTCDHCAEHLAKLAETDTGERPITLVRLKETHDTEANRVVFSMPQGPHVLHVELPDSVTYVVSTPAEIELEGGRIVAAREGISSD